MTQGSLSLNAVVKGIISGFPRCRLAHLPTPLEAMPRLGRILGVNLFIKRDDQTGLAFGGNKARKLEFILADAVRQGADSIITWGGVQSNWCRQTAAAVRKLGLRVVLILFKRQSLPAECHGNLLLDYILGADIRVVELSAGTKIVKLNGIRDVVERVAEEEISSGRTPYIAPIGGTLLEGSMSRPWGAIAYVDALRELLEDADVQGLAVSHVVLATGSGSTQAGLAVGARLLRPQLKVVGISVSEDRDTMTSYVEAINPLTLKAFGRQGTLRREEIEIRDEYIGGGYGILDGRTVEAIRVVAENEGVLLDPVYTGKAMAGLMGLIQRGYFKAGDNIVFLHTGGGPALFAYSDGIQATLLKAGGGGDICGDTWMTAPTASRLPTIGRDRLNRSRASARVTTKLLNERSVICRSCTKAGR